MASIFFITTVQSISDSIYIAVIFCESDKERDVQPWPDLHWSLDGLHLAPRHSQSGPRDSPTPQVHIFPMGPYAGTTVKSPMAPILELLYSKIPNGPHPGTTVKSPWHPCRNYSKIPYGPYPGTTVQ